MSEQNPTEHEELPSASRFVDSVAAGGSLTIALHIAAVIVYSVGVYVCGADDSIGALILPFAIGVSQAVYMVPAYFIAIAWKRRLTARGLLIGATMTFLLNAACVGFVVIASP